MPGRLQRTITHSVQALGVGFFIGRDVTIRFVPAPADHGIVFRRIDLPGSPTIPARIAFTVHRERRTAIERNGAVVEMTEHVLAALAGLHVDNCLVELDGPEPPGFDGSSLRFAEMLLSAGIIEQDAVRPTLVAGPCRVHQARDRSEVVYHPTRPVHSAADRDWTQNASRNPPSRSDEDVRVTSALTITYRLDYGRRVSIPVQELTVSIRPETFLNELAFSRTFVLKEEADALRAAGYGARTTARDLLVFGPDGPIDNKLRTPDECVRHKILDCLGDFALLGCDFQGHFYADRSGHHLNREMVRQLSGGAAQPGEAPIERAA
jgi:UDP-3-O-acyl-N-acetylglucosamine deacetylase